MFNSGNDVSHRLDSDICCSEGDVLTSRDKVCRSVGSVRCSEKEARSSKRDRETSAAHKVNPEVQGDGIAQMTVLSSMNEGHSSRSGNQIGGVNEIKR